MITLVASLLIGGGFGALLGRLGLGKSGAGSLSNNWKRSAVYGAALGFVIYAASGCGGGPEQPPKNMKAIAEANFETEVTQAKMPVVVDFYAPWCGPCKVLSPRLDALAGKYSGKIKFVQVNVDESPTLSQKFNVQAIPTVVFFGADGKPVTTTVGLVSEDTLRAKLEALLGK